MLKDIFVKGLRFMNHKTILPSVVRCVYRLAANREVLDLPTEAAWARIHAISPPPQGSVLWEMPASPAEEFALSVIIPFYNTEQYAVECIESVLTQTTDFRVELILVNDGSPDRCGEILDRYANMENVLVLHQQNQGLSMARNAGIAIARSPYLMFLDSDDYLAQGSIQALMSAAREYDADIVEGSHLLITLDGKPIHDLPRKPGVSKHGAGMSGYAWGKVIRKELFRTVCFPAGHWFEDAIMATLIFSQAATTVTVSDLILNYRQNPAGITQTAAGNPKSLHSLYMAEHVTNAFHKLGLECTGNSQRLLIMELSRVVLGRTQHFGEDVLQDIFIAACDIAQRYNILPQAPTGNYFYDEIVEALRHKQYDRWKWASMLI
jgi:hypothetical protein